MVCQTYRLQVYDFPISNSEPLHSDDNIQKGNTLFSALTLYAVSRDKFSQNLKKVHGLGFRKFCHVFFVLLSCQFLTSTCYPILVEWQGNLKVCGPDLK